MPAILGIIFDKIFFAFLFPVHKCPYKYARPGEVLGSSIGINLSTDLSIIVFCLQPPKDLEPKKNNLIKKKQDELEI